MVKTSEVRKHNEAFTAEGNGGLVCVFAGATSGIGAATLEQLASALHSATFYIAGRSAARFTSQRETLQKVNPDVKIIFFEGDISLLVDVDSFSSLIRGSETKVDYLYMSPGLLPLASGAQYTTEGLERCFSLSYYSRMRLTANLLPLLNAAPHSRVLSVLNGGKETALREDDLGLEKNWSPFGVIAQVTTLKTLAFYHFSAENPTITFMHAFPGLVKTDIGTHMKAPDNAGILKRVYAAFVRGFVATMMFFFGITPRESGERQVYHLTNSGFKPGVWLLNEYSDSMNAPAVVALYRESGWPKRVWEFTVGMFERALQGTRA